MIGEHADRRRQQIGIHFIEGFEWALRSEELGPLRARLNHAPPEFRGFRYEGAAMAFSLLDSLPIGMNDHHRRFLNSQEGMYPYTSQVGSGWALARTPWKRRLMETPRDPLLGWLMMDGLGFHQAYFHWRKLEKRANWFPRGLNTTQRNVFMQGVGRCLWFIEGGLVRPLAGHVEKFDAQFRGDLWSGIGLAAVYAGGADSGDLEWLRQQSGTFQPELAQGAAFAAKTHLQGGSIPEAASRACLTLCGCSAREAAEVTDQALACLNPASEDSYSRWRELIQSHFSGAPMPSPLPLA